jgi:hypothetical protein
VDTATARWGYTNTHITVYDRVRLKRGSGYGTERMRNGTDMAERNGTDKGLKCGTERNGYGVKMRNGYGVKMRNGTDMGLKRNLKFRP